MPYIDPDLRDQFGEIGLPLPESPGELNFLITQLCQGYLWAARDCPEDFDEGENTYVDYNAVIGALESAKLEFYRRMVVPYEDQKIKENGDVYR